MMRTLPAARTLPYLAAAAIASVAGAPFRRG